MAGIVGWELLLLSLVQGLRLDCIATLTVFLTALAAVTLNLDPGLAGLLLLYSIQLSGMFQWCVRQGAEVESYMTSVERYACPDSALEDIRVTCVD